MINILKTYNLLHYDQNMLLLYRDLKNFVDEKFPDGIKFEDQDRLLFIHQDFDFFVHDDFPGFTLYNLQLILRELDIPNFFCAIVSNMPNYQRYTNIVCKILRNDDVPIRAVSSIYPTIVNESTVFPSDQNSQNQIQYPFICLNRLSRFSRTFFVAKLFEKNLQEKGLISYHNIAPESEWRPRKFSAQDLNFDGCSCTFLSTMPFSRNNNENVLFKQHNLDLVKTFSKKITHYVNFDETADISNKKKSMLYQDLTLNPALIYVGTESTCNYPEAYVSEKSFKGICFKRPFIMLGSAGILKYLQELGFKTFSQWWDESYDQEKDLETKVDMIVAVLEKICELSPTQLQNMYQSMHEVLEHNYRHFTQTIVTQEKEKINQIVSQTFVERTDFFDEIHNVCN
jgi:hypothetical protein